MKKTLLTFAFMLIAFVAVAETASNVSFSATVYAKQTMSDNASPAYLVNWASTSNGITVESSQAPIAAHLTTLNIDASAISGTISSVSIYANSKASIVGNVIYNSATKTVSTSKIGTSSVYRSNGASETVSESDVITVEGSATTCTAYLLPVALTGGVKVTVKTSDGNFYTQDFTDDIAAGATKTLTITNTTASQLWMATIPGSTYFSMLSTPGAHDAATSGVTSYTSSSKCQSEDIATLLKNGVRCFDIRPGYYYTTTISADNLYIYHGQVSTNVKYTDAMATLVDFVKNNPTEAITITMVKENCKPTISLSSWTDRSSEMWTVVDAIQETYKDYMKTLDHSYYTLDDFRGKICYINRNGTSVPYTTMITNWPDNGTVTDYSTCKIGDVCYANIQDAYNSNGSTKQEAVESMLGYSSSNTLSARFHFNFCSSANSPASYAAQTNPVITTYLNDNKITGPTGYLYADYIGSSSNGGAALLTAIINQNYKYVFNGLTPSDKVADDYNMDLSKGSSVAWTKTGTWSDGCGTATNTYASEAYAGWGSLDNATFALTRTRTLPEGTYKLTAYALYRDGDVAYVPGSTKLIAKSTTKTLGSINIAKMTSISTTGDNDLQKAANSFGAGDYLNTVYFTLTEPTDVTFGVEGVHNGTKQWFVCGPMTLTKIDRIEATATNPVDVTSFITNPTIYNTTQSSCPSGWTKFARTAGNDHYTTSTGDTKIENWHGSASAADFDYYQALTLPAGKYTLGADLQYNGTGSEVGLYAYDTATGERVTVSPTTSDESLHTVSLDFTTTGGIINIGVKKLSTMSGTWFAADNFTLKYYGPVTTERKSALGKYGTICLPYNFTAAGASLYTIGAIDSKTGAITLTEAGTEGVAGTPYIYNATTADKQTFADAKDGVVLLSPSEGSNGLTGCFVKTAVPAGSYVLQTQNNVQGFYKVASDNTVYSGANKCYLTVPTIPQTREAYFFGDGEETAISAVNALLNGDAKIYDLNGRQLQRLQKGINIVNGKKIIVK